MRSLKNESGPENRIQQCSFQARYCISLGIASPSLAIFIEVCSLAIILVRLPAPARHHGISPTPMLMIQRYIRAYLTAMLHELEAYAC
jgi:hypothetical protein